MKSLNELSKKLDDMGWTLHYANDPVDGSRIVVLEWNEVAGLIADYEEGLVHAWDRGYKAGKLDEAPQARNHTNPYEEK